MDLTTLRAMAELMDEHGLTHIKVDSDGEKIEMDRATATETLDRLSVPVARKPTKADSLPLPATPSPEMPTNPVTSPIEPDLNASTTSVDAPMVGVFYAAPAPGADPFVTIGSKVHKGDTLCIIEAMKCMNEVQAERDGEIVDICASDGELVEYGRCLMKIG